MLGSIEKLATTIKKKKSDKQKRKMVHHLQGRTENPKLRKKTSILTTFR